MTNTPQPLLFAESKRHRNKLLDTENRLVTARDRVCEVGEIAEGDKK